MYRVMAFCLLWFCCFSCTRSQNDLRIMFYNVENLFDTEDDPLKKDNEFLPEGSMRWNRWKYEKKLRNIARVITAVGEMSPPAFVGLCEVENDRVVRDLTQHSPLRKQEYDYVMTDAPDERGIDVALLYQRDQFKLLHKQEYRIRNGKKENATRNILHVTGQLTNGETLDLFICHFPSRTAGRRKTEPERVTAAALLRQKVDSLFSLERKARIVIMGDFNDHPYNKSLSETLQGKKIEPACAPDKLYNLMYHRLNEKDFGSYKFRGKWEILDQFIVSGNLLREEAPVFIRGRQGEVFKAEFLLEKDETYYGKKPYRTYAGPRYLGGYSDHLPIFIDVTVSP